MQCTQWRRQDPGLGGLGPGRDDFFLHYCSIFTLFYTVEFYSYEAGPGLNVSLAPPLNAPGTKLRFLAAYCLLLAIGVGEHS